MKVAELLAVRRRNWQELETLCGQLEDRRRREVRPPVIVRFAALYRAACADLALASAYELPSPTVAYLHQLVGRAHNQLYRSQSFQLSHWGRELFQVVPRRLFHDNALRLAFGLFWGLFALSMFSAYTSREFATRVVGSEQLTQLEENYAQPLHGRDPNERAVMVGFYIWNNTGIGLRCFAFGLLGGVGGLFLTVTNALQLGAMFGHMGGVPARDNFFEFVTAHGPFELTAIVLSAATGMRLGFSLVDTGGLSRSASLTQAGRETLPAMGAAMVMFFLAALIEGFLSPSAAPYWVKAAVAALSSGLLLFYFVMLGQPPRDADAPG